ncbi:hypothetical protein [Aureimonas sp. Leaf324]|uniref:hypothetical protein n=1 Tax=Aureimonas sp. Leaf324 TaxID=1736336 RepID=UPI0006F9F83E|nr:hypothetical protein [Aureimonas sp. Leaf324]KQQ85656.1 hypothetical protein ASF65_03645 [Aureimonas sp. Leaf324]
MTKYDLEAQRGSVRRTDLRLRADYPHLRTEIHEIPPYLHVIYVPEDQLNLSVLGDKFADSYVQIGQNVRILNTRPSQGVRIGGIADRDIGSGIESLVFSRPDLETILAGCFPRLPALTAFNDQRSGAMRLCFASPLDAASEASLRSFMTTLVRGRPIEFDVLPVAAPTPPLSEASNEVIASFQRTSFKPLRKRPEVPQFVREEEDWWFASLPALFRGELRQELASFVEDAGNACYVQPNAVPQIDLRQALIAYDTIYMEPPPLVDADGFWQEQAVSRDDLLTLVSADRVRFLHTRPEELGDTGFLNEARQVNPRGVIGRRRSAAFFASDLVETADEYILGKSALGPQVFEIIKKLSAETGTPIEHVSQLLLGPDHARRACLQPLVDRGLMSFDVVGADFQRSYERLSGKTLSGEASYFGRGVHLAHALDATFVPAWPGEASFVDSWISPMRLMGDRLNFYRSANDRIAAAWAANERRKEERRIILPPIPIIEMRPDVGIDEILHFTSVDRRKGRALITRLADLPEDMRQAEVERLSHDLAELEVQRAKIARRINRLDAGVSIGAWYLNISTFPILPMFNVLAKALQYARTVPALEAFLDEIESAFGEKVGQNQDLTFLSKVSRVGKLSPVRSPDGPSG